MNNNPFSFKQKSQDFIVEEELLYETSGKGDAFYVYVEKQNTNTMDIVEHLCTKLKISRLTIGIAGLKDKRAITRQWFTIYKSALKRIGGEKIFLDTIAEVAKVLTTTWHEKPVGMTTPILNTFYIRLRAKKKLSLEEKKQAYQNIKDLFKNGFPNYFGEQRFGLQGRNRKQGKDILRGISDVKKNSEIIFKLQALSSKWFNDYIDMRLNKKGIIKHVDGDIIELENNKYGVYRDKNQTVQKFKDAKGGTQMFYTPQQLSQEIPFELEQMKLTGPVPGYNTLIANPKSKAGKLEQDFFAQKHINEKRLKTYKDMKIRGLRRAMRVYPEKPNLKYQGDDLLVRFSLPSGCYASILIDMMLKKLTIST